MAYGQANVDTIQSSTAGTPPVFKDGNSTQIGTLCRAWVNFNGTTSPGTIRAAFNVSSVTKNGTGDYTLNFITALSDANYSAVTQAGVGTAAGYTSYGAWATPTASSYRFGTGWAAGADLAYVSAAIFR